MACDTCPVVCQRNWENIHEHLSTESMIEFIKKKESVVVLFVALLITSIFFYKTVFHKQIPFPGDLLVNMMPYKTQSFDGFVPGTYPNKAQDIDVITQLYPWKYFAISEMKAGRIPFWNPH